MKVASSLRLYSHLEHAHGDDTDEEGEDHERGKNHVDEEVDERGQLRHDGRMAGKLGEPDA